MAIPKRSKKSKAVRTPKFVDEKYTGPEPEWDNAEKWSAEKYYRERSRVGFYYNYFYTYKDGKPSDCAKRTKIDENANELNPNANIT
mgnify:CR=1 FL=1